MLNEKLSLSLLKACSPKLFQETEIDIRVLLQNLKLDIIYKIGEMEKIKKGLHPDEVAAIRINTTIDTVYKHTLVTVRSINLILSMDKIKLIFNTIPYLCDALDILRLENIGAIQTIFRNCQSNLDLLTVLFNYQSYHLGHVIEQFYTNISSIGFQFFRTPKINRRASARLSRRSLRQKSILKNKFSTALCNQNNKTDMILQEIIENDEYYLSNLAYLLINLVFPLEEFSRDPPDIQDYKNTLGFKRSIAVAKRFSKNNSDFILPSQSVKELFSQIEKIFTVQIQSIPKTEKY